MQKIEGKTLGSYRVVSQIGAGGMATIYKAYQPSMDRTVALKVLPDVYAQDAQFVERFNREARTIAKLEHPNILPVYDFGEQDGITYLVMRFLEGGTLQEKMSEQRFSIHQAADMLVPICYALDYAHRRGIVHRDVKPSNILIDKEGAVYLSDFGIAKVLEGSSRLTQTGTSLGTPAYMSPEQCMGKAVDNRSDIYSLGVILYEMAVGTVPFQADTPMAVLFAHVNDPLPMPRSLNSDISEALQNVILKAMAKNPVDRYQTAAEMGAALRRAVPPIEAALPEVQQSVQPAPAVSPATPPRQPAVVPSAQSLKPPPPGKKGAGVRRTIVVDHKEGKTSPGEEQAGARPASRFHIKPVYLWILGVALVAGLAGGGWLLAKQFTSKATPTPTFTATVVVAQASTDTAAPTLAPTETVAVAIPTQIKKIKVGLVTDTAGINDKSFNQSTWAGIQKAAAEFGMDAAFLESKQASDYEANIDSFASQNYDVIITAGFMMGDATAVKAKQYPKIKFATLDAQYLPTEGSSICGSTVKDCYIDGGLGNVTSLMFQEDQAGFLAGVLAAGMSKTGMVCTVAGMEIDPVIRFVTGYENGAKWYKPDIQTIHFYVPSFTDLEAGFKVGMDLIAKGCDVIFAAGGATGNGGLVAAYKSGLMAIGVDVDQYYTYPEVQSALLSSAMKKPDAAVYSYLKSVAEKTVAAGIVMANITNDGVGLAPLHDWDSKVPQEVKDKILQAVDGLKSGRLADQNQSQLKIAVLAPITGQEPAYGVSMVEGVQLAVDEWNTYGGVLGMRILPVIEDSQCEADPALNVVKKVIDQDRVHYIIGEVCSKASIPISEIANANHVVQISTSSTNPAVVRDANGAVKPFTFVACFNDEIQGKVMARFAIEHLKASTAFIMFDQTNRYAADLADYFNKAFVASGGTIVGVEKFSSDDTDFSASLAKVAVAKPDVVVLPDYYNIVNLVTAQAKEQGIKATFIGGDGWDSPGLDLTAADGSYFTTHYSPTEDRDSVQAFVISYGKHYKDENGNPKVPDAIAALAYDATKILLQSIQAAGVDDPDKVKDLIASGKFDGVTGLITFDAFHTPIKPVTIVHITGGKAEFFTQMAAD